MKGFALDENGDVVTESNDIQMVPDTKLLIQKIRQILGTNRGEWWLNEKEGVPIQKILKKNPDAAMIKDCVRNAVKQVDSSLQMTKCDIVTEERSLKVSFEITGKQGTLKAEMEV